MPITKFSIATCPGIYSSLLKNLFMAGRIAEIIAIPFTY